MARFLPSVVALLLFAGALAVGHAATSWTSEDAPVVPAPSTEAARGGADATGAATARGRGRAEYVADTTVAHTPVAETPEPSPSPRANGPRRIDVLVRGPDGSPAAGATLVLMGDHPRSCYSCWREDGRAVADVNGRASFDVDAYWNVVRAWTADAAGIAAAHRTEPGESLQVTIDLERGAPVLGDVVDAESGDPVERAEFWLRFADECTGRGPGWSQRVTSGPDGRFASSPVPASAKSPELFTGIGGAPDHPGSDVAVTLDAGRLRVALVRGTRVRLRLVDVSGAPVAARAAKVLACDGRREGYGETDADGRMDVCVVLDPGDALEVRPQDGRASRFPASAVRDRERDLGDVVFREGLRVAGVVVDRAGRLVGDANVRLVAAAGGAPLDSDRTTSDGAFLVDGADDGDHALVVSFRHPDAAEPAEVRVTGVRGGRSDVRIELPMVVRRDEDAE